MSAAFAEGCASAGDDADGSSSTSGSGGEGGSGGHGGQGAGGSGTGGSAGNTGGGGAAECPASDGPLLAMDEIFLGDTDWQQNPSPNAWAQYGFDIDGQTTVNDFTSHCQPYTGATPSMVFPDGDNGIDNSFGHNVVPVFLTLVSDLSQQANQAIDDGEFTLILLLEQLAGPDQDPLTSKLWGGAPLSSPPLWDQLDCWPVVQEDLIDPNDIDTPKVVFPNSKVTGDYWESVDTATLVLPLTVGGITVPVTINHGRMSMQLAPSHQGAHLGRIGGVIDTEVLVELVRDVMGTIDSNLCQGSMFDQVATQIRQSSDIMLDGTQNPGATCNAISVGLGYAMLPVRLGGIAPPAPPPPNPCP